MANRIEFFSWKKFLLFFICSGLKPGNSLNEHGFFLQIILTLFRTKSIETYPLSKFRQSITPLLIFVTTFLYFTIGVKIKIYKSSNLKSGQSIVKRFFALLLVKNDMDVTTNVSQIVVLIITLILLLVSNKFETDLYRHFPFYLIEYFIRLFWPPVLTVIPTSVYYRPRKEMKRFLRDQLVDLKESF